MARHCPECGFVVSEGANYCPRCGAYQGTHEPSREDVITATDVQRLTDILAGRAVTDDLPSD